MSPSSQKQWNQSWNRSGLWGSLLAVQLCKICVVTCELIGCNVCKPGETVWIGNRKRFCYIKKDQIIEISVWKIEFIGLLGLDQKGWKKQLKSRNLCTRWEGKSNCWLDMICWYLFCFELVSYKYFKNPIMIIFYFSELLFQPICIK